MTDELKERIILTALVEKQQEYIELLGKEIADSMGIASIHGYRSNHTMQGVKLRLEINRLKERLGL